ncbi:4-nitrophenylphosphatase [Basidiobolus meristosporus CBS 931.73]|uniref:4-nitrophenylphosphatase n=1 Tax=Basidiobolus meristosporus CBS 931.73 TaxID=1314790 RepID=A0A1Y1XN68_9FUNG|nr:4-nitrophenylphosphatase [Basidiobolus meristosporus CBS 931.73]|eukprot:ORX87172.1 4-nitrophenylphosphatase [Basidiobolus meristosporus CBS 931.73]
MMHKISTTEEAREFLDSIDTFLFDCDGVLWEGDRVLDGVRETLSLLRQTGKRILFVTNNSTKSRSMYLKKLVSMKIEATEEEIFGSAYATAYYVKNILDFPTDKKVYAFGDKGLKEELEAQNVTVCGIGEDNEPIDFDTLHTIKPDDSIGAVILGFDINLNYRKYAKAFTYLYHNPECTFIATNEDSTYPIHGTVYPGTGAIISPVITALGRRPIVMGKPEKPMIDCVVDKYHLDKNRTCMVGDRLNTDILFGINGGLKTLLVLTGISKEHEILDQDQPIKPDFYANALGDLYFLSQQQ